MELGLKGKQVFITGGSVGIGLAVARAFAREGAAVAIGARNKERVEAEAAKMAEDFGVKTLGISVDVSKPEAIEAARLVIEKEFGGIDILINNAGTGTEETVMDSTDEKWYAVWDLHVMSTIRTARAFVPYMRKRGGGVILNTASICATQPLWYEPIYNTTKAALLMLGKCMANEFIEDNIRVNTMSPGLVLTPDWWKTAGILSEKEGTSPKEYLDGVADQYAKNKRFASPEEIAEYYVFLASDCGKYSVGSNYYVDGGWKEGVY
ncbi:MAG: SDR family NAD(P)-dependent oxidoreductase [Spirochaetales bacterium]|uniref:SDR family NAD(P)-dependent oxidoreductase n=1 Tax=Candidatus Thalassospirochaeta sargassi TaxID=3119039 RepID=A0AAJ1ILL7_9SPIO|nr:SDR family NAD(P)-dependent oxidoreductase [Spirochaetales bacterium]